MRAEGWRLEGIESYRLGRGGVRHGYRLVSDEMVDKPKR